MNVPWPKRQKGWGCRNPIARGPDKAGLGGNHTLEAKRRELRDSETFSSRGEMFTNMSLWREERGPNPSISGYVKLDQVSTVSPFIPDPHITAPI